MQYFYMYDTLNTLLGPASETLPSYFKNMVFNYIIESHLTKKHVNERNEIIPSFQFKNVVDFLSPLNTV